MAGVKGPKDEKGRNMPKGKRGNPISLGGSKTGSVPQLWSVFKTHTSEVSQRLDKIEGRLGDIEGKFGTLENKVSELKGAIDPLCTLFDEAVKIKAQEAERQANTQIRNIFVPIVTAILSFAALVLVSLVFHIIP